MCPDGKVRNLAEFKPEDDWPDEIYAGGLHVVPGSTGKSWQTERMRIAKSLGRKDYVLDTIAAMSGQKRGGRGEDPQN
jgi:hypothetical protein